MDDEAFEKFAALGDRIVGVIVDADLDLALTLDAIGCVAVHFLREVSPDERSRAVAHFVSTLQEVALSTESDDPRTKPRH